MKPEPQWSGGYVPTTSSDAARGCFCKGPQKGAPLCPCAMQGVKIKNGRYIKVVDLGPAPTR